MASKTLMKTKSALIILVIVTLSACGAPWIPAPSPAPKPNSDDGSKSVISIRFKGPKMTEFRTIDKEYKKIAAYFDINNATSIALGIVSDKNISNEEIIWDGEVTGTGLDKVCTITSAGTKSVSAKYKNSEMQIEILVNDTLSGINQETYIVLHPADTYIAVLFSLVNPDITQIVPFAWANETFPGKQHNTKADAARHCCWSMLLARYVNAEYAGGLTYAHEVSSPGPATETGMDLYNNSTGVAKVNHQHGSGNECCYNTVKNLITDDQGNGYLLYLDSSYNETDSEEKAMLQFTNK
jgi:hypothetical protein